MKTFRFVDQKDVTEQDFNDLPFWVDVAGELVWVSLQHHVVEGELYDTIAVQKVVDDVAQPVWQHYRTDDADQAITNMVDVVTYPKPIFFLSPADLFAVDKLRSNSDHYQAPRRGCCCEVEQGEPCYCNL